MSEMPDTAALVEECRQGISHARTLELFDQITAALERAERERDTALEAMREWNNKWKYASEHANAAEARAQKAEEERDAAERELRDDGWRIDGDGWWREVDWKARAQKAEAQRDHYKATLRLGIERLDKLEAVVEAARNWLNAAADGDEQIARALAALDEQEPGGEMDQDSEPPEDDLTYWAWTIIANVSEGDWTKQPQKWQDAATRWRDRWHETLPRPLDEQEQA